MKNKNELEELLQIQKKSSLNNKNIKKAYELLMEDLNIDSTDKYAYVLDFIPDIGLSAFIEHIKKLNLEKKQAEIQNLINYKVFTENISYKSTRRGIELVTQLYNGNCEIELIKDILIATCSTTLKTSKDEINKTITDTVRKLLFNKINERFFEMEFILNEKEFAIMEKLFINSAFNDEISNTKVVLKSRILVLKWLSKFKNKSNLNIDEQLLVSSFITNLNDELGRILIEDNKFIDKYGICINGAMDKETDKEVAKKKPEVKKEPTIEKDATKEDEKINDKDIIELLSFNELRKSLEWIMISIDELEKKNDKDIENLNFYLKEYQKVNKEKEELYNENKNIKNQSNELKDRNHYLVKEVERLKKEVDRKEEEIKRFKDNIIELTNTNSNLDNIVLGQFQNKLSRLLKKNFRDIDNLGELDPSGDTINFIEIKIKNIIKVLKNNGIDI